jgi:hypothetical protein
MDINRLALLGKDSSNEAKAIVTDALERPSVRQQEPVDSVA